MSWRESRRYEQCGEWRRKGTASPPITMNRTKTMGMLGAGVCFLCLQHVQISRKDFYSFSLFLHETKERMNDTTTGCLE